MPNVVGTLDVRTKYFNTILTTSHGATLLGTIMDVGNRIVEEVSILFPHGCAGLVGITVLYAGVTILPWNQDNIWMIGDGERRTFDVGLEVAAPLNIHTTNKDTSFDHTLFVTVKTTELLTPTEGAQTQLLALP